MPPTQMRDQLGPKSRPSDGDLGVQLREGVAPNQAHCAANIGKVRAVEQESDESAYAPVPPPQPAPMLAPRQMKGRPVRLADTTAETSPHSDRLQCSSAATVPSGS